MSDVDTLMRRYRRHRRDAELKTGFFGVAEDIIMFRRMLTPWLIRVAFLLALVGTAVSVGFIVWQVLAGPGAPAATGRTGSRVPPAGGLPSFSAWTTSPAADAMWVLLSLIGTRVICEAMIVVFQISETLTDMRNIAVRQHPDEV